MIFATLLALSLHEETVSSSRLEISGHEARVTFTFSLEDLAGLSRLDRDRDGTVSPEEWSAALPLLGAYIVDRFGLEGWVGSIDAGQALPSIALSAGRAPVTIRATYRSRGSAAALRIRCELFRERGTNARHVAELPGGRVAVFDRERTETDLEAPAVRAGLYVPFGGAAAVLAALGAAYAGLFRRSSARSGREKW